jgi:hypothetical protein
MRRSDTCPLVSPENSTLAPRTRRSGETHTSFNKHSQCPTPAPLCRAALRVRRASCAGFACSMTPGASRAGLSCWAGLSSGAQAEPRGAAQAAQNSSAALSSAAFSSASQRWEQGADRGCSRSQGMAPSHLRSTLRTGSAQAPGTPKSPWPQTAPPCTPGRPQRSSRTFS